jgi:hypothetical protein
MKNRTPPAPQLRWQSRRQQPLKHRVLKHRSRFRLSAAAGLITAAALTVFVGTVRHAALARNAAQPVNGQKLSPGSILAEGFLATWLVVTVVVFTAAVVVASRRRRRLKRLAAAEAAAGRRRWQG